MIFTVVVRAYLIYERKAMKINALSRANYVAKNQQATFGNAEKTKSLNPAIVEQEQLKPTLEQMQSYYGLSFAGRKEVADFLDNAQEIVKFCENFNPYTPVEDIKNIFSSRPEYLESFLYKNRDEHIFKTSTKQQIEAYADILGDKAPEVFAKVALTPDKDSLRSSRPGRSNYSNYTFLHSANPDVVRAISNALGDKSSEVFAKVIFMKNYEGHTFLYNTDSDKIDAVAEALGDKAPEVFAQAISNENSLFATNLLANFSASEIKALARALGDKAPEVLSKTALMQNTHGSNFMHCADADQVRAFADVIGKDNDEIFVKLLTSLDHDNELPIEEHKCTYDKLEAIIEAVPPGAVIQALAYNDKFHEKPVFDSWNTWFGTIGANK